ncbi:sugar porter family MFS transporter [Pokkaliibacter sp. CJK22405]|uniref:sugar porter family MFS transporter n=1 Tax=Pokkaliibacter sp. CJK22405 TaxID=3384615 RepID=UPI0039850737
MAYVPAQERKDGSMPESHRLVPMVLLSCFLAALAGLLFGLDIGVISGALPFIADDFKIDDQMQEWIVSSMMFGAAVGALLAGWLSKRLGRKYGLMVGALLFILGSALAAGAWSPEVLIFARVILGLAVGIASFTAPLYLSEIAPEHFRGSMISLYQLMITIGILAAFLSNTAFSYLESWRWMLGVIIFPAAILFIGVLALPRSPRWLATQDRFDEAKEVLTKLRESSQEVSTELQEIRDNLKEKTGGWAMLKSNPNFRRTLMLGIVLQIVQQFTGINAVMYYAPRIFEMAGFASTESQLWSTVSVGVVNVLATFIAIGLVDRWGRKPILYSGFVVMGIGMAVLGTLLNIGVASGPLQIFAVAMLLIFVAGFAMSAGPLIWILCSEIQPQAGRDFGITCSTVTNWIMNMLIGAYFLTTLNTLGGPMTFWAFAVLNVVFIIITIKYVPETKGVSLEHIERNVMRGEALVNLGK